MNKRSSALARIFAVAALAVALVVAIVAISGALGGDDSNGSSGRHHGGKAHKAHHEHVPVTYEVKSGDTLISIARRCGSPGDRPSRRTTRNRSSNRWPAIITGPSRSS